MKDEEISREQREKEENSFEMNGTGWEFSRRHIVGDPVELFESDDVLAAERSPAFREAARNSVMGRLLLRILELAEHPELIRTATSKANRKVSRGTNWAFPLPDELFRARQLAAA